MMRTSSAGYFPAAVLLPADHRVCKENLGIVVSLCMASIALFIVVENGRFRAFLLLLVVFLLTLPYRVLFCRG